MPDRRAPPPAATRKALAKLRRAVRAVDASRADLSSWEEEFAQSVRERLETYGSAFRDPAKGPADAALSLRQARKVCEIAKKGRRAAPSEDGPSAKPRKPLRARSPLKARKPWRRARPARDVDDDTDD